MISGLLILAVILTNEGYHKTLFTSVYSKGSQTLEKFQKGMEIGESF